MRASVAECPEADGTGTKNTCFSRPYSFASPFYHVRVLLNGEMKLQDNMSA